MMHNAALLSELVTWFHISCITVCSGSLVMMYTKQAILPERLKDESPGTFNNFWEVHKTMGDALSFPTMCRFEHFQWILVYTQPWHSYSYTQTQKCLCTWIHVHSKELKWWKSIKTFYYRVPLNKILVVHNILNVYFYVCVVCTLSKGHVHYIVFDGLGADNAVLPSPRPENSCFRHTTSLKWLQRLWKVRERCTKHLVQVSSSSYVPAYLFSKNKQQFAIKKAACAYLKLHTHE